MIPSEIKNNYLANTNIEERDFNIIEKKGTYIRIKEKSHLPNIKPIKNKVFIVLDGYISVGTTTKQGNEMTLYIIKEGVVFMHNKSILEKEISHFSYIALSDVHLLQFESLEELESLIFKNKRLTVWYINYLKTSLKRIAFRIEDLLTKSAEERYLRLQNLFPEMLKELKSKHIATFLGITPNSLSRIKANILNK